MIRRITTDFQGNLFEVSDLVDRFANDTEDPALAVACVIHFCGNYIPSDVDDVPIYTVH